MINGGVVTFGGSGNLRASKSCIGETAETAAEPNGDAQRLVEALLHCFVMGCGASVALLTMLQRVYPGGVACLGQRFEDVRLLRIGQ